MEIVIPDSGKKRLRLDPDEWSTASIALNLGLIDMNHSRRYRELRDELYFEGESPIENGTEAALDANDDHTPVEQLRGVYALSTVLGRASEMWRSKHGLRSLSTSTDEDPKGQDRLHTGTQITVNPDNITDAALEFVHDREVEIGNVATEACIRGLKALVSKRKYKKIVGVAPPDLGDSKTYSQAQAQQMLDQIR